MKQIRVTVSELSAQMYRGILKGAIEKGRVGIYNIVFSKKDPVYVGRSEVKRDEVTNLRRKYPPPVAKLPDPAKFAKKLEWPHAINKSVVLLECTTLGGKVWLPCAYYKKGKWVMVKLVWPKRVAEPGGFF